ncbi:MAG: penicillin-binding protein 2 [Kiritimatiellia bacterium]
MTGTMKGRFIFAGGTLIAAMLGLGVRLAFLHLGGHGEIRLKIARTRHVNRKILPGRGDIYDRTGPEAPPLALNLDVKHVCVDPHVIVENDTVDQVAVECARILGIPAASLIPRLTDENRRFEYVKRFVREPAARRLERRKLQGVFFRDATARYYPNGSFLCHVLGFVNHQGVGGAGIEQYMDRYLKGSPGLLESSVDGMHRELYWHRDLWIPALAGADVYLTIDRHIQYIVEKALDSAMREHHARGAWAVVQIPSTGEILAMAGRPAYDLNEFRYTAPNERLNRAIGYVYEPGSTFKVVTLSSALDAGTVKPDTVMDCEMGTWSYKGRVLRDYHPYGELTVADGIKKSSNILHAKAALTLGDKRFYRYMRNFGIGVETGIDLPGEESGILHPPDKWSNISATRIAMGQGVAVTALQMLGAVNAIANDGVIMRPYVIDHVVEEDGKVLYRNGPEEAFAPVSSETAAVMRGLLKRVTERGGTGTRAAVDGYEVCGKTGTAQKAAPGGYSDTDYVASFAGFLPARSPRISAIVVVDEPQPLHTGGRVAGPVFREIMEQTARYLNIAPAVGRLASAGNP